MKKILLLSVALCTFANAEVVLREDTASQTIPIGPFVNDAGVPQAGLTISNTDVMLSKNGAAYAAKNSGACTAATGADGMYLCTFDATDSSTVGGLTIYVNESGALPVYHEGRTLEEEVFDACCVSGAAPFDSAAAQVAAAAALDAEDGANFNAIPWNAAWDAETQSEVTDAFNAYDPPTNAELTARTLASASYALQSTLTGLNDISVADLRDAVFEDQGSLSLGCLMAAIAATVAGDVSTAAGTSTFEDATGTETRVVSVVASAGNRTTTITCPTY